MKQKVRCFICKSKTLIKFLLSKQQNIFLISYIVFLVIITLTINTFDPSLSKRVVCSIAIATSFFAVAECLFSLYDIQNSILELKKEYIEKNYNFINDISGKILDNLSKQLSIQKNLYKKNSIINNGEPSNDLEDRNKAEKVAIKEEAMLIKDLSETAIKNLNSQRKLIETEFSDYNIIGNFMLLVGLLSFFIKL